VNDDMPSPPFPSPNDALLNLIVDRAIADYRRGEVTAEAAILHAAVHGWLEGHLEGEQCAADCASEERWQVRPEGPDLN
jgi:hypothetical protein